MRPARRKTFPLMVLGLLVSAYVISGTILWRVSEVTTFALNHERVCIRTTQLNVTPRYSWMLESPVRGAAERTYWPVNSARLWISTSRQ